MAMERGPAGPEKAAAAQSARLRASTPAAAKLPKDGAVRHVAGRVSRARAAKGSNLKESEVPEDLQVIFGENLRAARLRSGLKQAEVAERAGVKQQYLSMIELGQQNVTLKTVMLLAKVVDHDASTMLTRPKVRSTK